MNRSVPEPSGLRSNEAMARLVNEGYHELPSAKPRRLWATEYSFGLALSSKTCSGLLRCWRQASGHLAHAALAAV